MSVRSVPDRPSAHVHLIPVGAQPSAVAHDPVVLRAYVSNVADRTVSVVDFRALAVVATVEVDGTPGGIAVSADGRTLYITATEEGPSRTGRLIVVEAADSTHVRSHPVGQSGGAVVCMPDGRVVVVDHLAGAVVTVEPATGTVTAAMTIPPAPGTPTLVPASGELVVPVGADSPALLAVNEAGSTVRARLDLDFGPGRCAITPDSRTLYVCDPEHGLLHRVDPAALQAVGEPIAVDEEGVSDVAIDPTGEVLRVVGADRLWTLDTSKHVVVGDPIPLPGGATDLALGPDGRRAVVALFEADSIAVVEFWAAG